MWPPVLAPADAKPVGDWTIVTRKDGAKQWAYDEHPLYTSVFDKSAGDVLGGSTRRSRGATAAPREPISPPPRIPPGFAVISTPIGRMVVMGEKRNSVYTFDRDTAIKSNCTDACLREWTPVRAADTAQAVGEWSVIEREPGVKQWAFRKKPLYAHVLDTERASREGSDVPGWHNVFTRITPPPPKEFTTQEGDSGTVLADSKGRTIYLYGCGDDAQDQLACDHPDTTQVYRFAMCGAGDPAQCLVNWPYVLAAKNARSDSRLWTTMDIDPKTGHRAAPGQADALHVWAYRDRPVYTFAKDSGPGDTYGDGRGEFNGHREGFKAFWLRDDYFGNAN
jgi:predicted lipoprotein with Yx(FWY)xxD motif